MLRTDEGGTQRHGGRLRPPFLSARNYEKQRISSLMDQGEPDHQSPLTITEVSKVVGASLLTKTGLHELLDAPGDDVFGPKCCFPRAPARGKRQNTPEMTFPTCCLVSVRVPRAPEAPFFSHLSLLSSTYRCTSLLCTWFYYSDTGFLFKS